MSTAVAESAPTPSPNMSREPTDTASRRSESSAKEKLYLSIQKRSEMATGCGVLVGVPEGVQPGGALAVDDVEGVRERVGDTREGVGVRLPVREPVSETEAEADGESDVEAEGEAEAEEEGECDRDGTVVPETDVDGVGVRVGERLGDGVGEALRDLVVVGESDVDGETEGDVEAEPPGLDVRDGVRDTDDVSETVGVEEAEGEAEGEAEAEAEGVSLSEPEKDVDAARTHR
jgi:hypothetical protein